MTDDDKFRDAAETLAAVDHQKARILMDAERDFKTAKDRGAVERAKTALIAAIQNGPRYHPYMVPTPLTDEITDDAFDDLLRPNAWKPRMMEEVEAKHRAMLSVSSADHGKQGHFGLRKRLIFSSVSVLVMVTAILIHWRIGVIVALILLAFACCRPTSWSD